MEKKPRNYATHHKLSEHQVQKIYNAYRDGLHDEFDLARNYGVSLTAIYDIVLGRSWRWLNLKPLYKRERRID